MVCALPLLPAAGNYGIIQGFTAIREAATLWGVANEVAGLLAYVSRYWLRQIKPAHLSVFGQARRTNNHAEGTNRALNAHIGKRRKPSEFVRK